MAEYYRIARETAVGLADEARRLSGVNGELTPAQMKAIFAGVTSDGGLILNNAGVFLRVSAQCVMNMQDFDFESSAEGAII